MLSTRPIIFATRGSPLALAQTQLVLTQCRQLFPGQSFDFKIIKTTGDKLQTASLAKPEASLPKGLFTKELELALLNGEADLAVHSLKDLPTELSEGLILGATPPRADVRDVLIYRVSAGRRLPRQIESTEQMDILAQATVATSSTRRKAQLLLARPDLKMVEIRGNVATRLGKVAKGGELDATVLALAGLNRLNYSIAPDGNLLGESVPDGLGAAILDVTMMLPCVGQAAIGVEIRAGDERMIQLCATLNHSDTFQAVTAERAFLRGMGGGCQSPVAAYAEIVGDLITLRAVSFQNGPAKRAEACGPVAKAAALGEGLAEKLR